jgi:hypothetical protein
MERQGNLLDPAAKADVGNCRHRRCARYENALQLPVSSHVDDKVLTRLGLG